MTELSKIKHTVQFPEQSAVPKEQSDNALFDILQEDVLDNKAYCQELINKIIKLPYAQLPDFFSHHCDFVADPIKWLNKFEKLISENEEMFVSRTMRGRMMKCYTIIESKRKELEIIRNRHAKRKPPMQYINAENEERYFSFREIKNKVNAMADYTDKIMVEEFITKKGTGFVCEIDDTIVGFSIVDFIENNVWALFLLPEHEGKGIGKKLHQLLLDEYFSKTQKNIWLSTETNSRAELFYKKQGWKNAGFHGEEIKFEMSFEDWKK